MKPNRSLLLIALLVLGGALACPAQTSQPFSLSDEPTTAPEHETNTASPFANYDPEKLYMNARLGVWGLSLAGHVGVRGLETGVDESFDDILDDLNIAAMPSIQISKGDWALYFNALYANLEDSGHITGPFGNSRGFDATVNMGIVDIGVGYTLIRANTTLGLPLTLTPVIGGRWTYLDLEIDPEVINSQSGNRAWFDPYVGLNGIIGITPKLDWQIGGNVGGFGVGSDFTWAFQTMLEWHFEKHVSLDVGYRVLAYDYDLSGFKWDVTLQGPWIGISINN